MGRPDVRGPVAYLTTPVTHALHDDDSMET